MNKFWEHFSKCICFFG